MEVLFSSFWTWLGGVILVVVVASAVCDVIRAMKGTDD